MVKRVVIATILIGIVAVVGSALWTRHQRAVAAAEQSSFESFCELNYGAAAIPRVPYKPPPQHIVDGITKCREAGIGPPN